MSFPFDQRSIDVLKADVISKYVGNALSTEIRKIEDSKICEISYHNSKEIVEAINYIKENIKSLNDKLDKTYLKNREAHIPKNAKYFYGGNTLTRLIASYDSCLFLTLDGYNYEPKLICRFILESLNFVFQIIEIKDFGQRKLIDVVKEEKIKNTNFYKLKEYCTLFDVGKMYGYLTKFSHFSEASQQQLFDEQNYTVVLKSEAYIPQILAILIQLLELNQIIFELVFSDELSELNYTYKESKVILDDLEVFNLDTLRYK